jgi:hypothetical protein
LRGFWILGFGHGIEILQFRILRRRLVVQNGGGFLWLTRL